MAAPDDPLGRLAGRFLENHANTVGGDYPDGKALYPDFAANQVIPPAGRIILFILDKLAVIGNEIGRASCRDRV